MKALEVIRYRVHAKAFPLLRPAYRSGVARLYCGLPGSGKTLCMVRDAVNAMRSGDVVFSNIRIIDRFGSGHAAKRLHDWDDVARAVDFAVSHGRHVVIALDEMHLWADSRRWQSTPDWLLAVFAERRHFNVSIMGTTQVPEQVEIRFRNLVDELVLIKPSMIRRMFSGVGRDVPLFVVERLDRMSVSVGGDAQDAITKRWYEWVPWWAYESYSTREVTIPKRAAEADIVERIAALVNAGE